MRPLQLDDSPAVVHILEKFGGDPPYVGSSYHRKRLVQWLEEAADHAITTRTSDIPTTVFQEPCGA